MQHILFFYTRVCQLKVEGSANRRAYTMLFGTSCMDVSACQHVTCCNMRTSPLSYGNYVWKIRKIKKNEGKMKDNNGTYIIYHKTT